MCYVFISAGRQKRFLIHEMQSGCHSGGHLEAQVSALHSIQENRDFLDNHIKKSSPQTPQGEGPETKELKKQTGNLWPGEERDLGRKQSTPLEILNRFQVLSESVTKEPVSGGTQQKATGCIPDGHALGMKQTATNRGSSTILGREATVIDNSILRTANTARNTRLSSQSEKYEM